jgi:biotin carboxyl carrier protein
MASSGHRDPLLLTAKVGGAVRAVEILELEVHRYRVTIDGVEHVVDARLLRPGSLSLLIDQRSVTCEVRSDGDRHRVDLAGRTIDVTLIDTLRHGGVQVEAEEASGPQEIRAMMPGKIVTVLVGVGDSLEKGQGVLVVEAMKMENEVKAAAPGVVRELLVKPGQAVESGELLARIE